VNDQLQKSPIARKITKMSEQKGAKQTDPTCDVVYAGEVIATDMLVSLSERHRSKNADGKAIGKKIEKGDTNSYNLTDGETGERMIMNSV
jgi:hypothetical protein